MLSRLVEREGRVMVFVGTVTVFAYLLLGGPLPGPVGEQYGTYLGALFRTVPSATDLMALMFRSSLIFLLGFSGSWLVLELLRRRQPSSCTFSRD